MLFWLSIFILWKRKEQNGRIRFTGYDQWSTV